MINIYTDGSYNPRTKWGGYGIYIEMNFPNRASYKRIYGSFKNKNVNFLELHAAIKALEYLESYGFNRFPVVIYSDSKYLVDNFNLNKSRSNIECWKLLENLKGKFNDIDISWVKGHNDEIKSGNTIAHYLSKKYKYDYENNQKLKSMRSD
jgi:ribonuclease HI